MAIILYSASDLKLTVATNFKHYKFKDAKRDIRARVEKYVSVHLDFWDELTITEAELSDLIRIKASLSYFMQCYWKRTGFNNEMIAMPLTLQCNGEKTLVLSKAQKNKQYYLRVKLNRVTESVMINFGRETYLDGIEVVALDIALHKAINLIQPWELIPDDVLQL